MLKADYQKLRRRDAIRVMFGGHGTQLAIVHGWSPSGMLLAFKLSAAKNRWTTKPVKVWPGEVIEKLKMEGELRNAPTLPPAYDNRGRSTIAYF